MDDFILQSQVSFLPPLRFTVLRITLDSFQCLLSPPDGHAVDSKKHLFHRFIWRCRRKSSLLALRIINCSRLDQQTESLLDFWLFAPSLSFIASFYVCSSSNPSSSIFHYLRQSFFLASFPIAVSSLKGRISVQTPIFSLFYSLNSEQYGFNLGVAVFTLPRFLFAVFLTASPFSRYQTPGSKQSIHPFALIILYSSDWQTFLS